MLIFRRPREILQSTDIVPRVVTCEHLGDVAMSPAESIVYFHAGTTGLGFPEPRHWTVEEGGPHQFESRSTRVSDPQGQDQQVPG